MDKEQIGNIYYDETGTYEPVFARAVEEDEAPVVHFDVPLRLFDETVRYELPVWLTLSNLNTLEKLVAELREIHERLNFEEGL